MLKLLIASVCVALVSAQTSVTCTTGETCNGNGVCATSPAIGEPLCVCTPGFVTPDATLSPDILCTSGTECCYEQKKQLTAFLLQWFFGQFGAGYWYAQDKASAGLLLGLGLGYCLCLPVAGGMAQSGNAAGSVFACLIVGVMCTWLVFNIIALVHFGRKGVVDGNGVEMLPW